jgi:hypothetical protein
MDIFVPCYCKDILFQNQIVIVIGIKKINNARMPSKRVNTFEVAVLRVLIKRQQPLKLSTLVNGFPDDCEDSVLSAVSSLKLHGYLLLDDYRPDGDVSINKERRKEVLQIVDSDIYSHKLEAQDTREKSNNNNIFIKEKKSFARIITRYQIPQGIRAMAISSVLIIGIISALGISMPTTSPDTEFVAYYQYVPNSRWSTAYGGGDDGDDRNTATTPDSAASASFVNLRDCNQKPSQQQT